MTKPEDMNNEDFFNYCLDLAVKQGRVKKTGTLKRAEPDGDYVNDVLYTAVLN